MNDSMSQSAGDATETARRILSAALQVEPAEIDSAAAIGQTERWDSLGHMRLILTLEDHLDRLLDSETIVSLVSFTDIVRILAGDEARDG